MNAPAATPTMRTLYAHLLQIRRRLVPDELGLGWAPVYMLGYLVFLFVPALFDYDGGSAKVWTGMPAPQLGATLLSIAVFLPLYFGCYRMRRLSGEIACMLGIAGLGYLLLPFNPFSNTYLIYAVAIVATFNLRLAVKLAWTVALLAAFLLQVLSLRYPVFVFAITLVISVAAFFSNHFLLENTRKRAELKLSHDEVRRLAALAERERIGRDLHDLLGHTLSLVALKSELAGKLIDRDAVAARREIDEVMRVARDALAQVRRAVTGIRAAGLAAELASAKLLLESDGVAFRYALGELEIPADVETALALGVREAVTNIQRHARASSAAVTLDARAGAALLRIVDDGRGGDLVPGNGLHGMRERIEALGGRLRVDSKPGKGTAVEIELPLPDRAEASGARGGMTVAPR